MLEIIDFTDYPQKFERTYGGASGRKYKYPGFSFLSVNQAEFNKFILIPFPSTTTSYCTTRSEWESIVVQLSRQKSKIFIMN